MPDCNTETALESIEGVLELDPRRHGSGASAGIRDAAGFLDGPVALEKR